MVVAPRQTGMRLCRNPVVTVLYPLNRVESPEAEYMVFRYNLL